MYDTEWIMKLYKNTQEKKFQNSLELFETGLVGPENTPDIITSDRRNLKCWPKAKPIGEKYWV